ncbi:MAG TPA: MBL fold metallo-hydrolase [Pseudonocardia sp.]|nr:MBL fold metallo-hydrolase [Pseudonocardia sp.]
MPVRILATAVLGTAAATVLARAGRGVPAAMGADRAALRAAATRSPHASGAYFRNTRRGVSLQAGGPQLLRAAMADRATGRPSRDVPLTRPELPERAAPLAATWFGHSSVLLEIDGRRVLADPMWSERASPSPRIGPRRLHPVPVPLDALPPVDAVLISHDHYDHLDMPTIQALARSGGAPFVVPLGVGAHLRAWGVPGERVVELDWNEETEVAGLRITCTEARHFSGRGLLRNTTLWSSWAVSGPGRRVFFGGDTGYTQAFAAVGSRLGPFDLAVLPIGAYSDLWPDVHMTPEEAVRAHTDLRADLLLPVHWGTFNLAFHAWSEPVDRLRAAAGTSVRVVVPRPGERIDAADPPEPHGWWAPIG